MRYILIFILVLSIPNLCSAWDGTVAGTINTIDVTHGQNYGFRITLKGGPKLCGNNHTWAYLNDSDSNYQVLVSTLLAAKMAGNSVRLYTNQEQNSGNNYCHIGYISVH
ncbi:hypothetical protein [Shewanella nanhaiensis]|uniref:Uncharacterized protein n=1 Tax=Shewanella nanhaiensis TaxID=2864872 RepID=A0ABS7E3J5_9GAMM|nr:hypothetical protein [Shewanella nanhaiensis]MBW8184268.1 hypothetical protein [Shewanella nanhaiensis]